MASTAILRLYSCSLVTPYPIPIRYKVSKVSYHFLKLFPSRSSTPPDHDYVHNKQLLGQRVACHLRLILLDFIKRSISWLFSKSSISVLSNSFHSHCTNLLCHKSFLLFSFETFLEDLCLKKMLEFMFQSRMLLLAW